MSVARRGKKAASGTLGGRAFVSAPACPSGTSQWTECSNSARIQRGKFDERASGTQAHLSTVLHGCPSIAPPTTSGQAWPLSNRPESEKRVNAAPSDEEISKWAVGYMSEISPTA